MDKFHYGIDVMAYVGKMKNFLQNASLNLNLEHPVTIQDKLAWLNIYDENPLKTYCADKIKLHDFCKEKLGEDLCIPIIKVYDKTDEINWDELPEQFVIKCNHGSGMNIIVKDKAQLDIKGSIVMLNKWMRTDFSTVNGFEAHYHDIERKIFVEKYMNDGHETLHDYKFWCFNGVPKIYTINDGNGHGDIMYYKMDGTEYNLYGVKKHQEYKKPELFDDMVSISKKLSDPFKFVRVDLYEINGQIYLGEMTFTPGACAFKYKNDEDNKKVGDLLELNTDKITKHFSPIFPNLHNDETGSYSNNDIMNSQQAINSISFKDKNNIVIYTCVIGGYDIPTDGFPHKEGYDYVLISDIALQTKSWKCFIPQFDNSAKLNDVKKSRCIKTNPFFFFEKDYEISVFIDANTSIDENLYKYIEDNKDYPITFKKHNYRNCIYDEIREVCLRGKEEQNMCSWLFDRYKHEKYPEHNGLFETNIIIAHHNDTTVRKLYEEWWSEIYNYSKRDQLSLNYVIWKNKLTNFVHSAENKKLNPKPHTPFKIVEQ